jgi:hypothetical protein
MKKLFFSLLLLLPLLLPAQGEIEIYCTAENQALVKKQLKELQEKDWPDKSIQEIVIAVGKRFLGTPYEGKTLEVEGEEKLVIHLSGLDCTTFLETAVVLARLVRDDDFTLEGYAQELALIRYRDGEIHEYPSRLHYFSDWMRDNEKKGILKDVTRELGGLYFPKTINFMGTHRSAYRQLSNDRYFEAILAMEQSLNQDSIFYIPQEEVAEREAGIHSGDVIGITSSIDGLDIAHTGLAIRVEGRIHLLHASSDFKKVMITEKPLADYLLGNKRQDGITVGRLR